MLLSPFPSLAAFSAMPEASASDAEEELTHPEEEEVDYYPTALTIADGDYTLDYLYEYFKEKVISDVASSSDALAAPQAQVERKSRIHLVRSILVSIYWMMPYRYRWKVKLILSMLFATTALLLAGLLRCCFLPVLNRIFL